MMTHDEKMIKQWRNERHAHCQFSTQRSYDEQHQTLAVLKAQLHSGEITTKQAVLELTTLHGYGQQGAINVVRKWEAS